MVFSSPAFIFLFLPIVLLCSVAGGARIQNLLLIAWSLFFYYYEGGGLLILLVSSCLINWALGFALERSRSRVVLAASLLFNIGLLIYFKYANFFVEQFPGVSNWQKVTLPIGISFFTFQGISYLIDVWRGELRAFRNPLDILLCISFFPI